MTHILIDRAQAFADTERLSLDSLDASLEQSVSDMVLGQLATSFSVATTWVDPASTPVLVQDVIAMYYVAFLIQRKFAAASANLAAYGTFLLAQADTIIAGIQDGNIYLVDLVDPTGTQGALTLNNPQYYPNDQSSALDPTDFDSSLGPAAFSMGQIF